MSGGSAAGEGVRGQGGRITTSFNVLGVTQGIGVHGLGGFIDAWPVDGQPDASSIGGVGDLGEGGGAIGSQGIGVHGKTNSNSPTASTGVFGENLGNGPGVRGSSQAGFGVEGTSQGAGTGVQGTSLGGTGVRG